MEILKDFLTFFIGSLKIRVKTISSMKTTNERR